jgi:dTDP-4-amino-4,6-dideoxygalactose transaminase
MKKDIDSAIKKCLEHQKWILGPEVKELEDKIAEYLGVKHCIGICSGTDALVLSLRALAIKIKGEEYWDREDLIITTPFTFTATGDAILRAGATPLFVDIDPVTFNIDALKIRDYLASASTLASQVVGILPVHLYGQSCQMDEIMDIAKEYDLFVLEDVAQAFGGMWHGSAGSPQKLGSIGNIGAFSFFPSKTLGGFGDGGMVATNDDEITELVRMLIKHGGKDKYNVEHIGYNARLDTLQAAILLAKLKYVDEFNERRRKISEIYTRGLTGVRGLIMPIANHQLPITYFNHVFHQYTIRVLNGRRDYLQKYLKDKGISTMVYYPVPLHKMKVFINTYAQIKNLKTSENIVKEIVSLPIDPLYNKSHIGYVLETILEFFKAVKKAT